VLHPYLKVILNCPLKIAKSLLEANKSRDNLAEVNLQMAILVEADFEEADLEETNLQGDNLKTINKVLWSVMAFFY
jgi:uncharacterized protein YjbI with pentapeptide repeats